MNKNNAASKSIKENDMFLDFCSKGDLKSAQSIQKAHHLPKDIILIAIYKATPGDKVEVAGYLIDTLFNNPPNNNLDMESDYSLNRILSPAIANDSVKIVKYIIDNYFEKFQLSYSKEANPLYIASLFGSINCVKYLSTVINPKLDDSSSLAVSAMNNNTEIVSFLMPLSDADKAIKSCTRMSFPDDKRISGINLIVKQKALLDKKHIKKNINYPVLKQSKKFI